MTTYKTSLDVVRTCGTNAVFDEAVGTIGAWATVAGFDVPNDLSAKTADASPWGHGQERLVATDLMRRDDGRRAWAMEADWPDETYRQRRWHLYVGLDETDDRSCTLAVRETCYTWPGWFGWEPKPPDPDVPGVVAALAGDVGLSLLAGTMHVTGHATMVDTLTAARTLARDLLDRERGMPVIVVRNRYDGSWPLTEPDALAASLAGLADVRLLDGHDYDVRRAFDSLFVRDSPSWSYRCNPGFMRVYQPGLDLTDDSRNEAGRHRFYTESTLASILSRPDGERELARQVRRALGRLVADVDVASIADVEALRRDAASHALAARVDGLRGRLADAANDGDLRRQIGEWQQIAESYAQENERLRARHDVLPSAWDVRRVERENERLRARERELMAPYEALSALSSMPSDVDGALTLACEVWPTRLVALPDAHDSARGFDAVTVDEAWQALRAMAVTLWPMLYGDDEGPDVEGRFKRASGFQLALREGATTRSDAACRRLREHAYHGRTILCEAHVKGHNDSSPTKAFRIYFARDDARRLLVIGHCGRHLDTARARRAANGL